MSDQTTLEPHVRGDPFIYEFELGNSWTIASFTGGIKFTLRESLPASSVTSDADVVDQATTAASEITGSGATGTVTIPSSRTTSWPTELLYWDLEGTVSGATPQKRTIDRGRIRIIRDVTRG